MRVVFSKIAEIHYEEILEHLSKIWTHEEINIFNTEYESILENVRLKLVTYPFYSKKNKIQYALLGKRNVKMFFKIYPKDNLIFVFDFFNVRKNPDSLNKL